MAEYDLSKVVSVIRQLQDLGEDKAEIVRRLKGAGVEQEVIDDAYAQVQAESPSEPAFEEKIEEEKQEGKLAGLISKRLEKKPSEAPESLETGKEYVEEPIPSKVSEVEGVKTTEIEPSSQQLDEIKYKVERGQASLKSLDDKVHALNKKFNTLLDVDVKTFTQDFQDLKNDLLDVKASNAVLEELMKKVLDSHKEVLNELRKGK